jgi:hypothetical protein
VYVKKHYVIRRRSFSALVFWASESTVSGDSAAASSLKSPKSTAVTVADVCKTYFPNSMSFLFM